MTACTHARKHPMPAPGLAGAPLLCGGMRESSALSSSRQWPGSLQCRPFPKHGGNLHVLGPIRTRHGQQAAPWHPTSLGYPHHRENASRQWHPCAQVLLLDGCPAVKQRHPRPITPPVFRIQFAPPLCRLFPAAGVIDSNSAFRPGCGRGNAATRPVPEGFLGREAQSSGSP